MTELHLPWLELAILIPLLGAAWVSRIENFDLARKYSVVLSGLAFFFATGAFVDFDYLHAIEADDRWHLLTYVFGKEIFIVDHLSAPLLPFAAALHFLTIATTLRTKIRRFSFGWTLASDAIAIATFSCKNEWGIIALLAAGTIPPYLELRARGKSTRIYVMHMALFVVLMVVGWAVVESEVEQRVHSLWAVVLLLIAVLVRNGIVPFHFWVTDLFENGTFGTALLRVAPTAGAYAAVRLVLPIAPNWVLRSMGVVSLVTAVYAAAMSVVQRDVRRFFCFLFLSNAALILVGLEMTTPIGLTGALCVWLSAGLGLGGFGLTLRALESRCGRLTLTDFQGHYDHTPNLAMCFVLTGLASVGFPGTFGFIGTELLVDSAVEVYPYVGVAVVLAAALNGIAIVKNYFLLFTGTEYFSSVSLPIRARERYAVLILAAFILILGVMPQIHVSSRYDAAQELLQKREAIAGGADLKSNWLASQVKDLWKSPEEEKDGHPE